LTVLPFFPLAAGVVFFVPFWAVGFGIAWNTIWTIFEQIRLDIEQEQFIFKRRLFLWEIRQKGSLDDLERVVLETIFLRNDHPVKTIALREGVYSHQFGISLSLSEKEWLQEKLDSFIQSLKQN
ncbi:MAG: hypothetical protein AAGA83_18450, partial [Cyanobacteria bacterium P01_F01_bin.116]